MNQQNNMPLVSVVVPVYNVAPYLRQCVESLLSQTLENIEIILVDDGSTDGSAQICDSVRKDPRVRVLHKPNEGLSAARNDGVKLSCAEYIQFVDGDDWVEPEFCEIPYRIARKHGAKMVCFRHNSINKKGKAVRSKPYERVGG